MSEPLHLRDYQVRCADAIEKEWLEHQTTLVSMATGMGKTVILAEIIRRRRPGRAIVLCHREELIRQARQKIEHFTGLECEIEMADMVASTSLFHANPVVIATVQTLISGRHAKRMERFNPADFSTIILDEAHHGVAKTFKTVLDYFLQNPDIRLLGVTATPDRTDELAMGKIFASVAFEMDILSGIESGYLVPVDQQMVTIEGLDFSAVRTTAGDLNGADLARIMESEKNLHGLCAATLDIIGARQTIVFTASVAHAEMACNIFNRHKANIAEWICGNTDKDERRKTISNMHSGKTQILVNVGIATEGFDCAAVEVIIMGRPTKSRSLFTQMAGRGTRPLPGIVDGILDPELRKQAIAQSAKKACLLVDFCGNSGRHKLITGLDILGGKYPPEVQEVAQEIMQREGGRKRIAEALYEAEDELREKERMEAERKRKLEEARKAKLKAKAKFVATKINPFDAFDLQPANDDSDSRGKTLTEKQRMMLLKAGVDPDNMTYANAKKLVDEQFRRWDGNLCSLKQAALLNRYGYDGANTTRTDASTIIDAIAKNGWKRPAVSPIPIRETVAMQPAEDAF